jgi:hypothetical protein
VKEASDLHNTKFPDLKLGESMEMPIAQSEPQTVTENQRVIEDIVV